MSRRFHVIIERDEDDWLVARVPELPGCQTQARTQDELMARVKEAILLYLETTDEEPAHTFVGVREVEVDA